MEQRKLMAKEGPDINEIEIIGIEFTMDIGPGENVELQMFPCKITIPRSRFAGYYMPKITFHTSMGDFTIGGRNGSYGCPW